VHTQPTARASTTDISWFTSSASTKAGTTRYEILKVSSSLLYVWLTTRWRRMYQMIANVALMKITFISVL
jgi:hypothetical protein